MIASCGARRLPIPSILSSRFGGSKIIQRLTASSAKIMSVSSQNGVASSTWKKWFDLLFSIALDNNPAMSTQLFAGKSTFLRRKSERELPSAGRFDISYRQRWKRSFVAKNFTWSNGNNPGKFSQSLRRARLKQKGGRHRRP